MSDQETPDQENVVAFRRKTKEEKSEQRAARVAAPDPNANLNINSSESFAAGDSVMCRIVRYVPGGFNVIIIPQNLHGYLPSNSNHQAGDEISALYVKTEKDRILLSQRAAVDLPNKSTNQSPSGIHPGQNISAKILRAEEGGYEVLVSKLDALGYLPTNAQHNVGDLVLATYVSMEGNRMLLSERFNH
ncbi:MAG: hypothetical protein SGJ27_26645 [Candidatus Melainabacteria bacterium]|nr:hypothetical protein [Candidatus Melainabacteria bacterium]